MTLDPASYTVAIPSFARPVTLVKKTLPLLARGGVDPTRITVYVASADEYRRYVQALPSWLYGRLEVAVPGMGNVRNFISRATPAGSLLLQVDDDIDDICQPDGARLTSVVDLHALFVRGFTEMLDAGATLWGVYPVDNPYFMRRDAVTTDLRYVVGALFGVLNEHAEHCRVSLDDKEDFERTILHYLHAGKVVRLNDVCLKTKFYTEPGGMQVHRTDERVTASAHLLAQRYPQLCEVNDSKKSGHTELRLADRRDRAEVV